MEIYKPRLSDIKKIAKKAALLDPAECKNAIYLARGYDLLVTGTTKYKNQQGVMLDDYPTRSKFDYICTAFYNNIEETENEILSCIELLDIFYKKDSLESCESSIRFNLVNGKENIEKLNGFHFNTMWNNGPYDGSYEYVIAVINGEHVELWNDFHYNDPYIRWLAKSKYKWKKDNYIRLYEGRIREEYCTPEVAKWIREHMICGAEFKMWIE